MKKREKTLPRDCGTCKYETLRFYESPCVNCEVYSGDWDAVGIGFSNWEPKEEEDKKEYISTDVLTTAFRIEEVLRNSGLSWSIHYIPSAKAYNFYLSEEMDVDSDE